MKKITILLFVLFITIVGNIKAQTYLPGASTTTKKFSKFKVLSNNLLEGLTFGQSSIDTDIIEDKFVELCNQEQPDVVAYQELGKGGNGFSNSANLTALGNRYGHDYVAFLSISPQPIGLTSKHELVTYTESDKTADGTKMSNASRRYLTVNIKDTDLYFIVCHHDASNQNNRKNEANDVIKVYKHLINNSKHVVILGDLNSATQLDDQYIIDTNEERLFERREKKKQEIDGWNKSNDALSTWKDKATFDYAVMNSYSNFSNGNTNDKIVDVLNEYSKRESYITNRSWGTFPTCVVRFGAKKVYTPFALQRNLQRIDYLLANKELADYTVDARIIQGWYSSTEDKYRVASEISDHFPVVFELNVSNSSNESNSSDSDIIIDPGFYLGSVNESDYMLTNSDWLSYTSTAPAFEHYDHYNLTKDNSKIIAEFVIRDGGSENDTDDLPTIVEKISFELTNSNTIHKIAIYDGDTELCEVEPNYTRWLTMPDPSTQFSENYDTSASSEDYLFAQLDSGSSTSGNAVVSFTQLGWPTNVDLLPNDLGDDSKYNNKGLVAPDNGSKTFQIRATFRNSTHINETYYNEEPGFYGTVSGKTSTAKLGEAENVSITIKDVMYNEFGSKMYAVDGSSNATLSNEKFNTLENKLLISNNSNVLNISGVENLKSVEIYNMNGIRVYKNTKPNLNVNISNLSKGLYIIKVETNEGYVSKKFLK